MQSWRSWGKGEGREEKSYQGENEQERRGDGKERSRLAAEGTNSRRQKTTLQ